MATHRDYPATFQDALKITREILSANLDLIRNQMIETESEQLVMAAFRLGTGRALTRIEFFSQLRNPFPRPVAEKLLVLAMQRANGKPLQYVTGWQRFLGHEYKVGPEVLIPRPETELLVTVALDHLRGCQPKIGFEIGVGSGAISIEILSALSGLVIYGTELTSEARALARFNGKQILGETSEKRLHLLECPQPGVIWEPFESIGEKADFLISNPPYMIEEDAVEIQVRNHEPMVALYAPQKDPLFFYREIMEKSRDFLKPGGWIFLEIPHQRSGLIASLFHGWESKILRDLNNRDRILMVHLSQGREANYG